MLQTLGDVAGQGVDIQLKLLQTLLSILTNNNDIHDEALGSVSPSRQHPQTPGHVMQTDDQTLLLCFKLQESRVSVVSSTAAATLRQAVMLVFDRVAVPDKTTIPLLLPGEEEQQALQVTPAAMDAYCIFSDLCLLTANSGSGSGGILSWGGGDKEKPKLLKLSNLQRTFGLELIESILSGYEEGVKQVNTDHTPDERDMGAEIDVSALNSCIYLATLSTHSSSSFSRSPRFQSLFVYAA